MQRFTTVLMEDSVSNLTTVVCEPATLYMLALVTYRIAQLANVTQIHPGLLNLGSKF